MNYIRGITFLFDGHFVLLNGQFESIFNENLKISESECFPYKYFFAKIIRSKKKIIFDCVGDTITCDFTVSSFLSL